MNVPGVTVVEEPEGRDLASVVRRAARRFGDRPFLSDREGSEPLSFAAFHHRTDRLAAGLATRLCPGEHVGVMVPNTVAAAVALFALVKARAVPVLVSTLYRDDLLASVLDATLQGTTVVTPRSWHSWLPPHLDHLDVADLPVGEGPPPSGPVEPGDAALVLPTSGTTGVAKGVLLPHQAVLHYAECGIAMRRLGPDDGVYAFAPVCHVDGLLANVLAPLVVGARAHLTGPPSLPRFWETCRSHDLTTFSYAGGLIASLHAQPERPDDADNPVRVAYGAPSPPAVARDFEARFGLHLSEGYGATECGIPLMAPSEDSRVEDGSCGQAVTGYDVRLAADGELLVRGRFPHMTMLRYVGDEAATRRRLPGDGWLHTGDVLADIGGGHFAFRGRKEDVIRRRGVFVAPVVVEQAAESFPGVVEAAAYAVAAPEGEHSVALAVTVTGRDGWSGRATDPVAALRRHLRERLPHLFVPEVVHVVDAFPRSPGSGKVQKHLLPGAVPPA